MLLMPVVACAWLSYIVVSCNLIPKLDIRVLLLENMDCSRTGLLTISITFVYIVCLKHFSYKNKFEAVLSGFVGKKRILVW